MKKIIYFGIAVALVAAVVSGCKPSSSASKENTLVVNITSDPGSLDPNLTGGQWERWLLANIFEGLTIFDATGKPVPGLAKDWKISNNGKTYTFTLKDAVWSDGVPVTAHDFEFSWKRILNPETAAQYAELLYLIKGGEAYNTGSGKVEDVAVKALDDKTLQVTLNAPAVYFVEMLEHPIFLPIPKHVVEKYGKDWLKVENLVYNGAYMLTEWKPQSHLMVTKNPKYRDAQNVSIENIKFVTMNQAGQALEAFRAGEVDFSYDFPSDKIDLVKKELDGQWYITPVTGFYYYSVNISTKKLPALKIKEVRDAMSMAIDRDFIVNNVTKSGETPAYSIVPPALYGNKVFPQISWANTPIQTRVQNAKAIMAKNGFTKEKPLALTISFDVSDEHKKIAVAIAKMWEEIGVKATFVTADLNSHFDNLQNGQYDIARARWIADYQEPSTMLYILESPVTLNFGKYSNKQFDKLVNLGKSTVDTAKRFDYYKQAEQIALNDVAVMPIYFLASRMLVSSRIQGFTPYLAGAYYFMYYSLKN